MEHPIEITHNVLTYDDGAIELDDLKRVHCDGTKDLHHPKHYWYVDLMFLPFGDIPFTERIWLESRSDAIAVREMLVGHIVRQKAAESEQRDDGLPRL